MNNENNKQFKTSDFYLASFCRAKGMKLMDIDKENPRQAQFVFQDSAERPELVEGFLFSRASVEPKQFVTAIKELKQLLHSDELTP